MPLELLEFCPVCGNSQFETYLEATDFTVTKEKFRVVCCKNCSFLFTNPRPDSRSIGAYYQSENYLSHHSEKKDVFTLTYNQIRKYTTRKKIALLKKNTDAETPTLLDYGCGTGYFLSECLAKGWNIEGIEPDGDASKIASMKLNRRVYNSIEAAAFSKGQFDIITLWHVLEHVHSLNETLAYFYEILNDRGILVIAVPNPESMDAKELGPHWAAYDLPRHLYHFTKDTMGTLSTKHHFTISKIHPMWFDAFYVSLLSTKNKYGNFKPVQSLKYGLKSNSAGKQTALTPANTSSLIYIVRKTTK